MLPFLTPWDYLVVLTMMLISAGIGVFFAIKSRRGQTSSNYFLGDRTMSVVPVSLSLAATVMSAITYLGTPAEVYIYGPKIGLLSVSLTVGSIIAVFAIVPVFYRLQITTVYEYLGMRFNNTLRFLVIAMKFCNDFLYMGLVVYGPALALSTVTKMNLTFAIVTVGVVCTFYTSIGGIKAVVWTDVFQALIMIIGSTIMTVVGTVRVGGMRESWHLLEQGGRTALVDFNVDPTVRISFWSVMIGGTTLAMYTQGIKQSLVQRYNSCRNETEAKTACFLGGIGMSIIQLTALAAGMAAYSYYSGCDPLTLGKIDRPDQILPYFMMDVFSQYPGMPGILVGGAFCASLSSLSSVLNAAAAAIGQDIIKTLWPNMSDKKFTLIVKIISAICGCFTIVLAFLASVLGDMLHVSISIAGVIGGPILGVFLLGMFVPRCNSKGAITGLLSGLVLGLIVYIGSMVTPSVRSRPPLSIEGCSQSFNVTVFPTDYTWTENNSVISYTTHTPRSFTLAEQIDEISPSASVLFRLSYMYLSAITLLVTFIVGTIVGFLTTLKNPTRTNPQLLTPVVRKYFMNDEDKKTNTLDQNEYLALKKV